MYCGCDARTLTKSRKDSPDDPPLSCNRGLEQPERHCAVPKFTQERVLYGEAEVYVGRNLDEELELVFEHLLPQSRTLRPVWLRPVNDACE